MREIKLNSKRDFANLYVDLFQILNVPEHLRVNDRLKEFLVHSVIMVSEGWTLSSAKGVKEISSRMGFSNKDEVYNYRKRLKTKGLLVQHNKQLYLPGGLNLKKIPERIIFKFAVNNEFVRDNSTRGTEISSRVGQEAGIPDY